MQWSDKQTIQITDNVFESDSNIILLSVIQTLPVFTLKVESEHPF